MVKKESKKIIALVSYEMKNFCDDYYSLELMVAKNITEWKEVTEDEYNALKKHCKYVVVEQLSKPDIEEQIKICVESVKKDEIKRLKIEARKEKRKAKEEALALEEKKNLFEKLKKELEI